MTNLDGPGFSLEESEAGITLVVTGPWSREAEDALEASRADGLELNYAKGFKDTSLAFVRDWPLKRLTVLARTIKDVAPIYRLSETLQSLSVQTSPAATLDLRNLPLLTSLSAEWSQVRSSIGDATNVQSLFLRAYSERNLVPLRWNAQLRRLRLKDRPRLESLDGLEHIRSIEHLGVYLAPLHDISALAEVGSTTIDELNLESCQIRDLTPVAGSQALRVLNVSDGGDVDSLRPLERLCHLEILWLFGTTKILDDDLSPILSRPQLTELRMRSRKSYRPPVEQIRAVLASRFEDTNRSAT